MAKNLVVTKTEKEVHIKIENSDEKIVQPQKWYTLTRSGLIDAAKTLKELLPIILYLLHKLSDP